MLRLAFLFALAFTVPLLSQERAPASRRVVEPETKRSAEETAAAENRASAKLRAKWRFDREVEKASKPEPQPTMTKTDLTSTEEEIRKAVEKHRKDYLAWLDREKARKARLAALQALAEKGPPPDDIDAALSKMNRDSEAAQKAAKAADDAKFDRSLEDYKSAASIQGQRNLKVALKVGQHRRISVGYVTTFRTLVDMTNFIDMSRAGDTDGAHAYGKKHGKDWWTPTEFVIIEVMPNKIARVRVTTEVDPVYVSTSDLAFFAGALPESK